MTYKYKAGDVVRFLEDVIIGDEMYTFNKNSVYEIKLVSNYYDDDQLLYIYQEDKEDCWAVYPEKVELYFPEQLKYDTPNNRHIHADMIKEWAEDTSKVVQYFEYDEWVDLEADQIVWDIEAQYRFKPSGQERVFPVTSLSAEALKKIFMEGKKTVDQAYLDLANAIIKQHILDEEAKNA